MANKPAVPAKGPQRPKAALRPTPKKDTSIDDLDNEVRRDFEAWRKEKERKGERGTPDGLLKEFLEKRKEKSDSKVEKVSRRSEDKCGVKKPRIDFETLAEKVFMRLVFEARIERERSGWAG
jgi:hypothetical protein